MKPLQNLHYAIGEIAYAIARTNGKIQRKEAKNFLDMITNELHCKDYDFDVADTIFDMMIRAKMDTKNTYQWAMDEFKLNSYYLSPGLKKKFIKIITKVTKVYAPRTIEKMNLLDKFKTDIALL